MKLNQDKYDECINGEETYLTLTMALVAKGRVIVGWSDGKDTHLDILLTYGTVYTGSNTKTFQRGLTIEDLFVSVMSVGAFGFKVVKDADTHPKYYAEKLGVYNSQEFADLINTIRSLLADRKTLKTKLEIYETKDDE